MSAEPALAEASESGPEFSDGDGGPPTGDAVAALLGAVLQRVRERGPFFRQVVDQAVAEIQAEAGP